MMEQYQHFIPVYGQINFRCMDVPHLLMLSTVDGHLGSFQFFGCYAAMNIHVHLFVDVWFSILFGYILGVELLSHTKLMFTISKMTDIYRMGKSKLILEYSI